MPTPTKADRQFGDIAIKNKLLTKKQVDECLAALEEGDIRARSLAEAVEQKGLLSARAIASIARAQNYREVRLESKLFGRIAIKSKFATLDQVRQCLEAQKKAYLEQEPPPEIGKLLVSKGFLSKEQEKAIRDALAKLDKEEHVARAAGAKEKGGGAKDGKKRPPPRGGKAAGSASGSGRAAAGAPAGPAPGKKDAAAAAAPASAAARKAPARPLAPAPAISEDDDVEPDEELDRALDPKEDIETSDRVVQAESAEFDIPTVPSQSSSVSESRDRTESGRAAARPPAKTGSARIAPAAASRDGALAGAPAARKKTRDDETGDDMDAILAPDDLDDLRQLGVDVSPRTIGAPPPKSPAPRPSSDSERLPSRFAPAAPAAPRAAGQPAALEPIEELEDEVEGGPALAAAGARGARPASKVDLAAPRGARECPQCKVTIDAGTSECLYCGFSFAAGVDPSGATDEVETVSAALSDEEPAAPAEPALGEAAAGSKDAVRPASSGRADAAPPAAAAEPAALVEPIDGVAEEPFERSFRDPQPLARGCRGEILRATEAASGEPKMVVRLPASLAPEAAQVRAFLEDAEKLNGLGLRPLAAFERLSYDARGYYAVYAGAPGKPLTALAESGAVIDRMRAARLTKEVATALSETSAAGVLARELRPEMVFLEDDPEAAPVIAGLGLARLFEPPARGVPAETDAYVPPERLKKADRADVRTEIFGIGAVLKLLLSGSGPTGKEPKELPNVPGGLKTILMKTLDPVTGKRYVDYARLLEDIEKTPGAKGYVVKR